MPDIETPLTRIRTLLSAAATNSSPSLWILFLVATFALGLRLDSLSYVTESLWYEDGFLYLTGAHKVGLKSLLIPYMGYLNTYPRIVALLTSQAPLVSAPYFFFGAWLISFYSIVWVLRSRASVFENSLLLLAFLVIAIAALPVQSTVFFTLTTSNIFLAVALTIYICVPSRSPPTLLEVVFLALSSITGPYSTFMLPVLAAQLVLLRDFFERKAVYLIVTTGGLIQLIVMMTDGSRAAQLPAYPEWIHAITSFFRFGDGDNLSLAAASLFWLIILVYTIKSARARENGADGYTWQYPMFVLVSAVSFFLVGALAVGPRGIRFYSPMDTWGHYFIIPYSLLFLAALVSTRRHRAAQTAVMCLISTICGAKFIGVEHPDRATSTGLGAHTNMQWIAFTKFQKIKPDLLIPINSALPVYPPLSVQVTETVASDNLSNGILLDVAPLASSRSLELPISKYCDKSNYIGLEIYVWRSRMGYAAASWGRAASFDSNRSLRRFYPDKDAVMQFAFYRDLSDDLVRLDLAQGVAASAVVRTLNNAQTESVRVVAKPTAAGGSVRIDRIILFCLQ